MLNAIHGVSFMLNAIQEVKLYAHCYTWREAICSLLYMERSFMPIAILGGRHLLIFTHGVRLYAHCYK